LSGPDIRTGDALQADVAAYRIQAAAAFKLLELLLIKLTTLLAPFFL